jgi:hypothetical protein
MTSTSGAVKPMAGSLELVLELIWQHAMKHLEGTKNEVLLPMDIVSLIGSDNVDQLKNRLRYAYLPILPFPN